MFAKPSLPSLLLFGSSLLWAAFYLSGTPTADEPKIEVPPGFVVEHLFSPTAADSSSWVALAADGRGRFYASDQYGALYRIAPPAIGGDPAATQVETLAVALGKAQGLLWAFNSLYVVVSSEEGRGGHNSGLYRVLDADGDDRLDTVRPLKAFDGAGEHGPHAVVLGPDSLLYVIAGNYTKPPEPFTSRLPRVWEEDGLFPALLDPRGHAVELKPPGGWIMRTDSLGRSWELWGTGFRNAYDLAFNPQGDLFTFDSDMEWDLGMPWYRPIRVCHVTSGSDFGWRTGSGKWPAYYPDTLPPVVEVGQGSPTGVVMGTGAAFPTRYRQGVFVFDWSFGTMYFVGLTPDGASYSGTLEEFLTGVPLPLTDGLIGADGALYFATGGRDLDSHFYRVYYRGEEATTPPPAVAETPERTLRRQLEAFHGRQDPAAVDAAWPHLSHPDRFVRYAARIAVEHQPVATWVERVLAEPDPLRRLYGVVALARHGDAMHAGPALQALQEVGFRALTQPQQLDLLRAYGLVMIRLGVPSEALRARIGEALAAHFPADSDALNRELAYLLAYLEAPGTVEKTLSLLEAYTAEAQPPTALISEATIARSEEYGPDVAGVLDNPPEPQEIAYARALSFAEQGWTLAQRRRYFRWFYEALRRSGGRSYKGFIEIIRTQALDQVPREEQEALADLTGAFAADQAVDLANLPQPEGPGRNWNLHDVMKPIWEDGALDEPRDFARGRRMYAATLCQACHTMRGEGGNVGPDLTQVGTRFSREDLVEAILSPSAAVSDQYAATLFTLADGSTVVGRVVREDAAQVVLNQNPFDPGQTTTLALADVQARELSPVSIMPPRLVDRLNQEELLDLLAYLLAGGDPDHELYQPDSTSTAK